MPVNSDLLTQYFGDAITDTGILLILVVVDTILALTYSLGTNHRFTSGRMLSGILRNVLLSVVPLGVRALALIEPRQDDLYSVLSAIFFIFIGWAVIVSILSYLTLLGLKFPKWLLNIVSGEIETKTNLPVKEIVKNDTSRNASADDTDTSKNSTN